MYSTSSRHKIVTNLSTEAELVALSDCVVQGILLRKFLIKQGFTMGPVEASQQDNMFTIPLIYLGPSALGTFAISGSKRR